MSTNPSMSELRAYFEIPPRQRWSSIARQPQFRRLLAPGENPRNLERILKDLYRVRGDATAASLLLVVPLLVVWRPQHTL